VTFIDDFSKKTWVLFINTNDEVFSRFHEFRALVQNRTCKNINLLRLNNGLEYTSNDFKDLCKGVGMNKEMTISYIPLQNGVLERNNLSIISYSRDIIHDEDFIMF
jgi:transposase InsO family protein